MGEKRKGIGRGFFTQVTETLHACGTRWSLHGSVTGQPSSQGKEKKGLKRETNLEGGGSKRRVFRANWFFSGVFHLRRGFNWYRKPGSKGKRAPTTEWGEGFVQTCLKQYETDHKRSLLS